eukprot:9322673-Heterocapsa_arctica.AAC.1
MDICSPFPPWLPGGIPMQAALPGWLPPFHLRFGFAVSSRPVRPRPLGRENGQFLCFSNPRLPSGGSLPNASVPFPATPAMTHSPALLHPPSAWAPSRRSPLDSSGTLRKAVLEIVVPRSC